MKGKEKRKVKKDPGQTAKHSWAAIVWEVVHSNDAVKLENGRKMAQADRSQNVEACKCRGGGRP